MTLFAMKMNTMKNSSTSSDLLKHVKYQHLVAGVSGGVASSLILHPLDLIKIRFAVNDGRTAAVPRYNGLSSAFMTIIKQEGFRGLYRGVTPNVWGSGSAWGLYFLFYNTSKGWLQSGNTSVALAPYVHYLAATQAGMLSLVMTNPLWVVKTRLCLQNNSEHLGDKKYKGMVDGLAKIYKNEGIRGLYKGFVPGMFGVTHGALQFMAYEEMKNSYNVYRNLPIDCKLTTLEYIFFAASSKLVAASATYPYQVVRARMQDHHRSYKGVWHCITETWRYEGWRGFYKGLKPSLVRVVPATVITFVTYENVSHFMLRRGREIALPA